MHRRELLQTAGLLVVGSVIAAPAVNAAPLPPAERDATLAYIAGLRNEDGGYRAAAAPGPSALSNTVPALRTYDHLGVAVPRPRRVLRFVLGCHDAVSGGFGDTPGAKPDVRSTAMGLMALAELKQQKRQGEKAADQAVKFLVEQAKSPAEIYIAGAALDAAKSAVAVPASWYELFEGMRKPDGSYGESPLDTATAAITLIRIGRALVGSALTGNQIAKAQRTDGGFAGPNGMSDLSTAYRMMRALFMLKTHPNQGSLRQFISRCRNSDGGYGPTPGAPSAANSTYYAVIVSDWSQQLGD